MLALKGMSIGRRTRDGRKYLSVGFDRHPGNLLGLDGTAGEERSYFHASRSTGSLSQKPARHEFAIEHLGQAGWLKPHRYRYYCIRCRWLFLVENRRGDALAVDELDRPLSQAENTARVATFAIGPCPAALPELDLAGERRGLYRRFTHSAPDSPQEGARSGLTSLQKLFAALKTAVTKRLSYVA